MKCRLFLLLEISAMLLALVSCRTQPSLPVDDSDILPSEASSDTQSLGDESSAEPSSEEGIPFTDPYADAKAIASANSGYSTILRVKSTGSLVFTPYISDLTRDEGQGKHLTDYDFELIFTLLAEDGTPVYRYDPISIRPKKAGVDGAYDFFLSGRGIQSGFRPTLGRVYDIELGIRDHATGNALYYGYYKNVKVPENYKEENYQPTAIPEIDRETVHFLGYTPLEGGRVEGDTRQKLKIGEGSSKVTAIAEDGYKFVCWNDGVMTAERVGDRIADDHIYYAIFKSKQIENRGIPCISIDIGNGTGITDRETWKSCTVDVTNCENGYERSSLPASVRGRGNGSWTQSGSKKPFKIKFDKKINLLGIGGGSAKDWVFLPQATDLSLMRTYMAFSLGRALDGIDYCSACLPVEIYLNGRYMGVYILAEQVEVGKHRIPINDETDTDEIGYLVELDRYASGKGAFRINGEDYEIKSDYKTDAQRRYIIRTVEQVDAAIRSGKKSRVEKLVDLDSLIDMFLLQEYLKNTDAGWSSFYFYADAGEKLQFGAPWDFDCSQGNDKRFRLGAWDGFDGGEGYDAGGYDQDNEWFVSLWKTDWFKQMAAKRWYEITDTLLPKIYDDTKAIAAVSRKAIDKNYELYPVLEVFRNYDDYLNELMNWHENRKQWMDEHFREYL